MSTRRRTMIRIGLVLALTQFVAPPAGAASTRPGRDVRGAGTLEPSTRESEKLASYLLWLGRVERERAVLRDTGMSATNARKAFERLRSFERSILLDHPSPPEKLQNGDRYYLEALLAEVKFSIEIIETLQDGKSREARKLAREGSSVIDRQLGRMRKELSWYFRQRSLGDPPAIAASDGGSYFGYLAGHAPR